MPKSKVEKELPFSLDPLDPKFVGPKPKNSVEESVVDRLMADGNVIFTRKRDGYGVIAVVSNGRAKIYSRTVERDLSAHFPDIIRELICLCETQKDALFCGELVWRKNDRDSYETVAKYVKMDAKAAALAQAEGGHVELMLYNVLAWNGKDVAGKTNAERIQMIHSLFASLCTDSVRYIFPVEMLAGVFTTVKDIVRRFGWEGVVIYDATESTQYRLDGRSDRPPRPLGCWKWKPHFEDDFIAYGWEYGTKGKAHERRMGKLYLSQKHPVTGELIRCGEVGIGFSNEEREQIAALPRNGIERKRVILFKHPWVVQVEYQKRFPKSKALHAPSFVRRRDDKKPEECLLPQELL